MNCAQTSCLTLTALLALLAGTAMAQADADAEAAQLAFNNHCRTCHVTEANDNRLGPSLHAVVGRKAGSVQGFGYSPSMQHAGIVWDEATLDRFIEDPDAVVPGNAMKPFSGIASAEERARIVAYLKAEGGGG